MRKIQEFIKQNLKEVVLSVVVTVTLSVSIVTFNIAIESVEVASNMNIDVTTTIVIQ